METKYLRQFYLDGVHGQGVVKESQVLEPTVELRLRWLQTQLGEVRDEQTPQRVLVEQEG